MESIAAETGSYICESQSPNNVPNLLDSENICDHKWLVSTLLRSERMYLRCIEEYQEHDTGHAAEQIRRDIDLADTGCNRKSKEPRLSFTYW